MKMAFAIAIVLVTLTGAGYLAYEFSRTSIPAPSPSAPALVPATATSTVLPASPLEQSQQLVVSTEELIQSNIITATGTSGGKKILFLRSQENVAKYFFQTGSEDSTTTYHFYYDQRETLRAAIIKARASNGSKLHHAIYFGEDGITRLSEEQVYETGVTYSWPKIWPEEKLIRNPQDNFRP